jgi:hypothetical protein
VTVAHSIDPVIKKQIYNNNAKSFILINIDICTHCGHLDIGKNGVRSSLPCRCLLRSELL